MNKQWLYTMAYNMLRMYKKTGKRGYRRSYKHYRRAYRKAGGKLKV